MSVENPSEPPWGGGQEMTELESTMWRANRHPENSTQGGVLEVLDGTPDWDELVAWHRFGLEQYPRFTQKVVEPALPVGPPVWVDDPEFDLDHHLTRVRLDGAGTMEQLLDVARDAALVPLDAARAPWRGVFIEGLEGGRSAYFLVVHHCLMDGHGSVQLLADLHGRDRKAVEGATRSKRRDGSANTWAVAAGQVVGRARKAPRLATRTLGIAVRALRDPAGTVGFVGSIGRVLAQPQPSESPLLSSGARTNWQYGVLSCDLGRLKAAGRSVGGTINDAYVSAVLGGLRRYHEAHGEPIGDVVINMPVSMRGNDDPRGGNRFAAAFLNAPSSVVDPAERMRVLRSQVQRISKEPALDFFSIVLPVLNRAPVQLLTPLFTGMQNRTDVTISNVPGMRHEVKMLGVPVSGIYYFGPLPGSPVMVVLYSLNGSAHIGINCDGDVFDPSELFAHLQNGLDEILALAGP